MTDITPIFNVCLGQNGSRPVERQPYNVQQINSFLQEAHSINARIADLHRELRAIRPSYLSTAPAQRRRHGASTTLSTNDHAPDRARPLNDAERDAFDAQSKLLLRQLHGAITHLQQAEEVRNQTADSVALAKRARGGLGALGRWAAGGAVTAKSVEEEQAEAARHTITAHREAVILFLQRRLGLAGKLQGEMMDVRLSREVEKSKSILAKSAVAGGIPYVRDHGDGEDGEDGRGSAPGVRRRGRGKDEISNGGLVLDEESLTTPMALRRQELTPDQMQVFAEENHELLRHYEDQLDQVRTAEKSILEISELHTTLHANLQQQSESIDQLVQDSYFATENLGKGNKELKKATERRSTAQAVFYSTVAFCSFLVIWDLVF